MRRYGHMYMDGNASKPQKERAIKLLTKLQRTMRQCNSYVQDFVTAGEIFAEGDVDDAHFVIEPKARPKDAHKRTYKDPKRAFNEVSVMTVEPRGGKVPKRSVVIRARGGGLHDIDETSRAFDPLHFVLLFPCGDDGWTTGLHKCPKGERRARRDNAVWDAQAGVWVPPRGGGARAASPSPEDSPENNVSPQSHDDATGSDSNPEDDPHDDVELAPSDTESAAADSDAGGSDTDMEDTANQNPKKKRKQQVSVRQYYSYQLHQRASPADPEPLFRATRLFQEYCCMSYAKQEMQRLRFYDTHQDKIRADLYQNS